MANISCQLTLTGNLFQARAAAAVKVLDEEGSCALQYSTTEGFLPLRQKIADRMNPTSATRVSADEILVTSGSQHGLDLTGKVFLDEGDIVFYESPAYLGAINALRAYELRFVEVPTDDDGMIPREMERLLANRVHPKLISR